jgi:acyl carrier protein
LEKFANPDAAFYAIAGLQGITGIADMQADKSPTTLRVAAIIINELKLEEVTPDSFDPDLDLVDEVGIDSMDLATIALVIRDEFGIRIDEDDYPKLTTLRIIANYIDEKKNEA